MRPRIGGQPSRSRSQGFPGVVRRALAPAIITLLAGAPPLVIPSASFAQAPASARSAASYVDDLVALGDAARARAERVAAAQRLLHSAHPDTREQVLAALAGPITDDTPASIVAEAIARGADVPADFFPAVAERLRIADAGETRPLIAAMGSFRTRASARAILAYTAPPAEPAAAEAAYAALARLTGRDDLPRTRAAWDGFLRDAELMAEDTWRAELLRAHAARADRREAQAQATGVRLAESLRKSYLALPDAERSACLASLLRDELDAARDAGIELVSRELAAARVLSPAVGEAAAALLDHPDAIVRAHAATLVTQLNPPGAGDAIAVALVREDDPLAASALLEACARVPTREAAGIVLRWMSAEGTSRPTFTALWSLERAGLLDADERAVVLARLREMPTESYTGAACSLLAAMGEKVDRDRLVPLLSTGSPPVRAAVARALAGDSAFADAILDAAASDPALFAIAARATLLHHPDATGFERLRSLPAPSPAARRDGRLLVAAGLPGSDLLAVAQSASDAAEREELLELLTSENRILSERAAPDRARAIFAGGLQLASMRLAAGRADDALATLNAVEPLVEPAERDGFVAIQASAFLVLDRVELAERLPANASAWLHGLALCVGKPHAGAVADALFFKFGPEMSDADVAELSRLRDLIAKAGAPKPAPSATAGAAPDEKDK